MGSLTQQTKKGVARVATNNTAEIAGAKKNVDQSLIVGLDGEKFDALRNPAGSVRKEGEEDYRWVFLVDDVETLVCQTPFPTAAEAEKNCRKMMGIAWNFSVTIEGGA